jgi:hypothetical protein
MKTFRIALATVVASAAALALVAAPAAATTVGGYDNPSCTPAAAHPDPVVLLHGLGGNGPGNLGLIGTELAHAGYCTFDTTYGEEFPPFPVGGLIDVNSSAQQIAAFVTQVRHETGAAKVDIVGHSEGGFMSLYVPKHLGLSGEVNKVVALAPPTHGTTFGSLVTIGTALGGRAFIDEGLTHFGCVACDQLIVGGSGITALDHGPIAQPGVTYTIIASRTDELVTPHQSATTAETAFVHEPGVTNEYVQSFCPFDPVGHLGLAYDSGVENMIANALDPAHATKVACSLGLPL